METNEDGKDVVVGGYEYQIFDTIADKLKYVVFMYECIKKRLLVLSVSNMIYLYQKYVACGVVLWMTRRKTSVV